MWTLTSHLDKLLERLAKIEGEYEQKFKQLVMWTDDFFQLMNRGLFTGKENAQKLKNRITQRDNQTIKTPMIKRKGMFGRKTSTPKLPRSGTGIEEHTELIDLSLLASTSPTSPQTLSNDNFSPQTEHRVKKKKKENKEETEFVTVLIHDPPSTKKPPTKKNWIRKMMSPKSKPQTPPTSPQTDRQDTPPSSTQQTPEKQEQSPAPQQQQPPLQRQQTQPPEQQQTQPQEQQQRPRYLPSSNPFQEDMDDEDVIADVSNSSF